MQLGSETDFPDAFHSTAGPFASPFDGDQLHLRRSCQAIWRFPLSWPAGGAQVSGYGRRGNGLNGILVTAVEYMLNICMLWESPTSHFRHEFIGLCFLDMITYFSTGDQLHRHIFPYVFHVVQHFFNAGGRLSGVRRNAESTGLSCAGTLWICSSSGCRAYWWFGADSVGSHQTIINGGSASQTTGSLELFGLNQRMVLKKNADICSCVAEAW